ncbi:hypothetical protein Pan181_02840 [Aeoliella mucimassa]|uniref:Uncharacterized protein n=2 Tax=Aeoliella mucimassa TaxID=2527972 RepID=A0A518AHE6_9BACT|nr:hypothetical protein Pan181_02840 [Aeoliella mucimassa]
MVAVAAVVALFVKNRPYGQTSFLASFDPRAELAAICQAKSHTLDIGAAGEGASEVFGGGYELQADYSLSEPSTDVMETEVMLEWYQRIKAKLQETGCDIIGESQGGEFIPGTRDYARLTQFSFRYRQGTAKGVLRVYLLPNKPNKSRLLLLLDEY